jgi:uncharacterized membrane protein YkoI
MMIKHSAALALAASVGLGLAGPAFAGRGDEVHEQTALQGTKVTLTQAISAAEQQTGGKAFDAGVDIDHGRPRIVVETNGPNGVQMVTIDAQNGRIVGTRAGGGAD